MKVRDSKSNFLRNVKESTEKFVRNNVSLGEETARLVNNSKKYAKDIKSKTAPMVDELRIKSTHTFSKTVESGRKLDKKKLSHIFAKIGTGFLYGLEKIVGRISIGYQYGTKSLRLLEELAKMKELGVITEEEYKQKKKDVLSRI